MSQVFARYAKDMLERQTYPEVRRAPNAPPEAPYDVTAWSLGMLLGVDHVVVKKPLADAVKLTKLDAAPALDGKVAGNGPRFVFDYRGDILETPSLICDRTQAAKRQSWLCVTLTPPPRCQTVGTTEPIARRTGERSFDSSSGRYRADVCVAAIWLLFSHQANRPVQVSKSEGVLRLV